MAGVSAGNPAGTVLGRGLVVLMACYGVGRLLEIASAAALADADAAGAAAEGPRTLGFDSLDAAADAALATDAAPARRAA